MKIDYRRERIDRGIKVRCEDIYALLSIKEVSYLLAPRILPITLMLIFPLFHNIIGDYWEKTFFFTCLMAIMSMSWELLSYIGLISLGHAMFFGIGAYVSAIFNVILKCPIYISIISGSIIGGFFCTLFLIPASKLKGIYFVMITLCMPIFLSRIIEATNIVGGTSGISGMESIGNYYLKMYVPILFLIVCIFSLRRFMASDYGLIVKGIKDNELCIMSSAINTGLFKFIIIFISSIIGCFSGAFMAHYYRFAGISAFSLDYSIIPLTCSVFGGYDSFVGSVLAAFIIVPILEYLRCFGTLRIVIYSVMLMIFLSILPEGLFHYIKRKYHQFERWKKI